MRIQITDLVHDSPQEVRVRFLTSIGAGAAVWNSDRWRPNLGEAFYVEFEIDDPVAIGKNARLAPDSSASMTTDGSHVQLTGFFESIDPDQVGYFRLAEDCLIMLEIADESIREGQWLVLTHSVSNVSVFPFDTKM